MTENIKPILALVSSDMIGQYQLQIFNTMSCDWLVNIINYTSMHSGENNLLPSSVAFLVYTNSGV